MNDVNLNDPHLRPADGPPEPDYLAGAVLNGLARPVHEKLSWGFLRTLLLGIGSFGVLPILVWTKRFRQYITLEQQQLWHLAEWVRLNSHHPQAALLKDDAEAIRPHFDLRLFVYLSLALMTILFFTQLTDYRRHWCDALLNCTYLYPLNHTHVIHYYSRGPDSNLAFRLFNTWTLALTAAYASHWVQVRHHASQLRQFIARFNTIAAAEGLTTFDPKMPGVGARPVWLVGGVAMAMAGALWGVPMMMAGAIHQRMVRRVSTVNRASLALRLRTMLLARRPHESVLMPVYLRPTCPNTRCRAPVSETAAFCPRCGSRLAPAAGRMA